MGGGGVMRAAAKVAGIGVVNGGLRAAGFSAIPTTTEQSMVRSASGPVSAAIVSTSQSNIANVASVQGPSWGFDDWEFADGEELLASDAAGGGQPMARVVFGGAPTLQEAKDATSELKDALDKVCLSSPESTGCDRPFAGHVSGLSLLPDAECVDNKSCITCDPKASPVPKYAMRAFSLLNESPAAQSVVASIASDPNVWNAVMRNDALVEFLDSYKTNAVFQDAESPKKCEESSDESQSGNTGSTTLADFLENIKLSVVEMVSNVSAYVQNMFGYSSAENSYADDDGKARSTFNIETTLGASFMALAVMVITVVVLRRA